MSAKLSNQLYCEISPDNATFKCDKRVSVLVLYISQVYTLYSKRNTDTSAGHVSFMFAIIIDVNLTFRLM